MEDINIIYEKVNECRLCNSNTIIYCSEVGMKPAVMKTNLDKKVLVVATNPGEPNIEKERGLEYEEVLYNSKMGKDFLNKLKFKYYYSNMVKCATKNNRETIWSENKNCVPYLINQIKLLYNLKIIILLGRVVISNFDKYVCKLNNKNFYAFNEIFINYRKYYVFNFPHPSWIFRSNNYVVVEKLNKSMANKLEEINNNFNIGRDSYEVKEYYKNKDQKSQKTLGEFLKNG